MTSAPAATTGHSSLTRDRWIVTIAAVIWIVGTLFGSGVIGGGVSSQGDGLFTDSATLIAPDGPAFSIWSVIYVGLAAYVIWQWLPMAANSRWASATRIPAAVSIALNGVWLLVVQADLVWLSVLVILAIAVSIGLVIRGIGVQPPESLTAHLVVGLVFGLYLGWVCVATCANIASYLVGLGVAPETTSSVWITVAVLAVVVLLVSFLIHVARHASARAGIALAAVWGAAWVSIARFSGELQSETVAYAAAVAAVLIAVAAVAMLVRSARTDQQVSS